MNKKFIIISLVIALLIVATITVSSYAYFTIANKEGEETVITSGTMSLLFTDGNTITANNMIPGDYIEKEFTVKNTGNVDTSYDIYLSEVINTLADKTDFVYELISNDGGYNTTNQIPSVSTKIVSDYSIGVGVTHHYKLKLTFLNKNENQDDNQGKEFKATIQVNEYKDVETTVNYYIDNVLVSSMPTKSGSNYISSSCDKNAQISFDEENWDYELININQNHTTCNIYFRTIDLASISVVSSPTKTVYEYNDVLDLTGLEVRAIYADESYKVISLDDLTFIPQSGSNLTTIGENNITVSYTEKSITKTTTFDVTVNPIRIPVNGSNTLNQNAYDGDLTTYANTEGTARVLYLPDNVSGKNLNFVYMFDTTHAFFNIEFYNENNTIISQTKNNITDNRSCFVSNQRTDATEGSTAWYCGIVNKKTSYNVQHTDYIVIPSGAKSIKIYTGDAGPTTRIYDIFIN